MIIELADLFEVSTDVLLGYEWRNSSMGAAIDRIIVYRQRAQYDDGVIEAEKALKKYSNCFDIVYQSAVIYSEKGYEQKDQKASIRAQELFDMACSLIEQNTDENISELSNRCQMARIHLSLGHADTCVDICIEWLRSILRPGYPPEATAWFDKYDCVLLVLCAETYCAMGDND